MRSSHEGGQVVWAILAMRITDSRDVRAGAW